jgi:hypothetical protein
MHFLFVFFLVLNFKNSDNLKFDRKLSKVWLKIVPAYYFSFIYKQISIFYVHLIIDVSDFKYGLDTLIIEWT